MEQMYSESIVPTSGSVQWKRVRHYYISPSVRRVIWLSDVARENNGEVIKRRATGHIDGMTSATTISARSCEEISFPNGTEACSNCSDVFCRSSRAKDDLVLDFFAGSGTLAQAVLAQNKKTVVTARFILVQLPGASRARGTIQPSPTSASVCARESRSSTIDCDKAQLNCR